MQIRPGEASVPDEQPEIVINKNNNNGYMVPWSFDTNWTISNGFLLSSVTVESSDYPIDDSVEQDSAPESPLVLEPPAPDFGPCEIKIYFRQKYNIGQVYVRSTARVYEIYYAISSQSDNEYLCTVRCGAAERDEILHQTTCFEDVGDLGEGFTGEITDEILTNGRNTVSTEDDWVQVKGPEDRSSSSNKNNTVEVDTSSIKNNIKRRKKIQDIYEATAQISDADPCTALTIRLLSLQDKGCVYVDEVFVYVDPVESTDAGNQAVEPGSSTASSLMSMLFPTLLQLSKSSNRHIQDKHASYEVQKDVKMETRSIDTNEIATGNNCIEESTVDQQNVKLQKGDECASEPVEVRPSVSALNTEACVGPVDMHDPPQGCLERALEQLVSRVCRVEDICLRFEEKMLKPIESMEARLLQIEQKLEMLAKDSQYPGMQHCARISAPPFSCSQSSSSSVYNEGSDKQPCEESELEKKDSSSSNSSGVSHNAPNSVNAPYSHPSLVVSAPEFLSDEDEEDNDNLEPLKSSPCVKSKKSSIDAALAAALSGFLSANTSHSSENAVITSGFPSGAEQEERYAEHATSFEKNAQDSPPLENSGEASVGYTQYFPIAAPDLTAKEVEDGEHFEDGYSPSDLASTFRNEKHCCSKIVPPSIQIKNPIDTVNSRLHNGKEDLSDLESTCIAACDGKHSIHLDNGLLDEISEPSNQDIYLEGDIHCSYVGNAFDISLDQAEDLASDSCQITGETRRREPSSINLANKQITAEQDFGNESGSTSDNLENAECTKYTAVEGCWKYNLTEVSESSNALVDFDIPILDVKFDFNDKSTKSPLEVLLDGEENSNFVAVSTNVEESSTVMDGNEPTAIVTSDDLLVDLGNSSIDLPSDMQDGLHNLYNPGNQDMFLSLI